MTNKYPTNRYKFYFDISIKRFLINKEISVHSYVSEAWCRRLISIYLQKHHQVCAQASFTGHPINILDTDMGVDGSPIQSKIRIFSKKRGGLKNLHFLMSRTNEIKSTAHVSEIKEVPETVIKMQALVRIRLPSRAVDQELHDRILTNLSTQYFVDYVHLLPSSRNKEKKLIRYYYIKKDIDQDHAGKANGYGFSSKNKIAMVPIF